MSKYLFVAPIQCSRNDIHNDSDTHNSYPLKYLKEVNLSYAVDFHFSVKASSDAFVEFMNEEDENFRYKIGLGTTNNRHCQICQNNNTSKNTPYCFDSADCFGVISGSEIRSFWIRFTTGEFIPLKSLYSA